MKKFIVCWFAVLPIFIYQKVLAPFTSAGCCRFYPSCSNYAIDAIFNHGVIKGGLLALWRLLRCQPLAQGGFDPVPLEKTTHLFMHQER